MSQFISPKLSAKTVVSLSNHVKINPIGISNLAKMIHEDFKSNIYDVSMWKRHELHPKTADEKAIDWIFLIDTLNFSFWPDRQREYAIDSYTGYWALCAGVNRAINNGIPITDPKYYSNISEEQVKNLFQTDNGNEIPLIKERVSVLQEAGSVLLQKFGGSFVNCIRQSNCKAIDLLTLVVNNFPSYRDVANYKNHKVSFYKRAQILVADIWACFEGTDLGHFQDIDQLTMFADYRVPQVLAYFSAIEYSHELYDILKKNEILPNGHELEVEIRSASIWAVELIKEELNKMRKSDVNHTEINSIIIDFFLWNYRRNNSKEIDEKVPFHKVRSIFY